MLIFGYLLVALPFEAVLTNASGVAAAFVLVLIVDDGKQAQNEKGRIWAKSA